MNKEIAVYDNTVSARTYLSYIAEQAGGIAVIGRDGKLYIKTIGENSVTLPLKLFKTFKWGEKYKITRVRYDDGIQLFEKGDTTGNTVYISQDNMYIVDQEQIDNIYNALKGLEFYSFEGECIIDPALDTGDIVVIDGKNVIYQGSMQFSGRWIANIQSKIQCKAKEETTTRTPSQKTINRRVESNINQIDGKITQLTKETTENSEKLTKVEQDVNGIDTKVSSVEQSVENITNTEGIATGKNIHLEDSSDEPLVSIKVKGSTTQATRSGKNRLPYNYYDGNSKTVNGITFTVNKDKSITANGTATANASFSITNPNNYAIAAGSYKLIGENNTYTKQAIRGSYKKADGTITYIGLATSSFTIPEGATNVHIYVVILQGETVNNVTFYPMLLNSTETDLTFEAGGASPSSDYRSPIENVEGKNKFNKSNMTEATWDNGKTNTVTLLEDGRIQSTANFAQWSAKCINIPNLKANTDYVVSGKIISSTANNAMIIVKGYKNNTLSNIIYHQYAVGTRFELSFNSSDYEKIGISLSGSNNTLGTTYTTIFDEIQIEEGTVATDYVPYNSLEIKDIGKNLYNDNIDNYIKPVNYWLYPISLEQGATYKLSGNLKGTKMTGCTVAVVPFGNQYSDFEDILPAYTLLNTAGNLLNRTITVNNTFTSPKLAIYATSKAVAKSIFENYEIQLEKDNITTYTPYQEQKVTFPLSEGQKLYKASYLASNGIHNKRKQIVLDGTENCSFYPDKTHTFRIRLPSISKTGICTHYKNIKTASVFDIDTGVYLEYTGSVIISDPRFSTIDEIKAYLAEQYSKGTPVTVEYELLEEEIIPYTEAQQEAWDKIEELHTYKNVTNIFSTAELDITYVRDNGLSDMYETKQNANKNYTKTIQKLAEQKITTDEISSKVSSLETTTVKEIQVQYALGDSSVTAPETGWNTTAPEWQNGKYMWQRTVTVYANETTVESSATCIQGAKGEDGKKGDTGATGTGIKSIQEQYYLSTSNTTQTGGSWKNTQDIWTVGKYIWTRSHITWSDNTTTDTTPVLAQGLNTANETANDTKENLENNYSTTVEMNSAITAKANEITTEVNKKVNETDLGTKIEQNYEHVKFAWNQISEFIQMMIYKNKACLAILDEQGNVMTTFNQKGEHFYDSSGNEIGTIGLIEGENSKQIAFAINGVDGTNQMAWGVNYNNNFIPVFYFEGHNTESGTEVGGLFYFESPVIMQGNYLYLGQDEYSGYLLSTTDNGVLIGGNQEDYLLLNDLGIFAQNNLNIYADNLPDCENISRLVGTKYSGQSGNYAVLNVILKDGNGFSFASEITTSDIRLKKNIQNTDANAIDIIKKLKHRKFKWKQNGKEQKIGYIAQELQEIDNNFVYKLPQIQNGKISNEIYNVNMLPLLATATKAIQELQEEIEEQQRIIKKMQEEINELKSREV